MKLNFKKEVSQKGLLHSYDSYHSTPEEFIDKIKEYGHTSFRSPYYIKFNRFRPYKYFIVLLAEKGTRGQITAWGLCDTDTSMEISSIIKTKYDGDSFMGLDDGKPGHKDEKYKSVFKFLMIKRFKNQRDCKEFTLIKVNKEGNNKISSLTSLRSVMHVKIPLDVLNEIESAVRKK